MAKLPRRSFVLALAGLFPVPFLARRFHARAVVDLEPRLLRALGAAVLPSELGSAGLERTVAAFERWLAGYREGAELLHGYGTGEIRLTGPSPALRWTTQLRALATAAQASHGTAFEQLDLAERQALVRAAVQQSGERLGAMPAVDRATHVSIGLLAFFYDSPEANDLCYQARIGNQSCRPLALSPGRPAPLPSPRR